LTNDEVLLTEIKNWADNGKDIKMGRESKIRQFKPKWPIFRTINKFKNFRPEKKRVRLGERESYVNLKEKD
jgi:Neuraminidase (sialidase)